jgi:hypothetical protein
MVPSKSIWPLVVVSFFALSPGKAQNSTVSVKTNDAVTVAKPTPSAKTATTPTEQKQRPANPGPAAANQLEVYQAMVLKTVGTRWHKKIANVMETLPAGTVRIQYTIDGGGLVTTKLLDPASNMETLNKVSADSIKDCALFPPFSGELQRETGDQVKGLLTFTITPDRKASLK